MHTKTSLLFTLFLGSATLACGAYAQDPGQPAPIVRPVGPAHFSDTQPTPGVWVHAESSASVKTVSTTGNATELRIEQGRADVRVNHPAGNTELLVDLPGGQVSLLKDGFYTFNAQTNTVRVLRGEAEVFPANAKAIKVKEDHELSFTAGGGPKSIEVNDPRQLTSDVLPGGAPAYGDGPGYGYGPYSYGYAPYGDGPYPYPYPVAYGWGYPYYGWGYPYGFGLGIGFYGGFHGGYGRFGRR
jgi:hypothetical protein